MKQNTNYFDIHDAIKELKHYLPAQAPLKDFVHHNTLHAFQKMPFFDALRSASQIFGYKVQLTLSEYRSLFRDGKISEEILDRAIRTKVGNENFARWKENLINKKADGYPTPRVGILRSSWKKQFKIDMDSMVHPILFRVLCSYLDQGISLWSFPINPDGFLETIIELERNSSTSLFKTTRSRNFLLTKRYDLDKLLKIVVGDHELYKHYIFDLQFAHQGWSGMVSAIEDNPDTLLDKRVITTKELIIFELLLEIDALDSEFGEIWAPLCYKLNIKPIDIFSEVHRTDLSDMLAIWQEAYEWTYYDEVLAGMGNPHISVDANTAKTFQALFCLDDREGSFRRYVEKEDPQCETFGTPGHFNVEFFFQPEHGKFYTKLCPAPMQPKFLIKESGTKARRRRELFFTKFTHSLVGGWIISQTLGFWSILRLIANIFRPTMNEAGASSFRQMDRISKLTIENKHEEHLENDLQVGFTFEQMADRVEVLLKSIGLINNFAPIVYVIGHGASSVNNPHYAAYDCGACCGRPGSVNARVVSYMANHPKVRQLLSQRDILIPDDTQFLGGLHDTTRDEIMFFDEQSLLLENEKRHNIHRTIFDKALDQNAKERSRRFASIDSHLSAAKVHSKIKTRSVALFEPRPELNHATNALCIIGKRELTKSLFLDRRAFMNSYDYKIDPDGTYLLNILKAAAPVCGGINLEYYFSRVDNQKLGAGTKLPHNVMGLFGVANGIDGDLRPGLPSQMIEVHDPVRLMMIVEHFPEVVLATLKKSIETYEWFLNEWIYLVVENPDTFELSLFKNGSFVSYKPLKQSIYMVTNLEDKFESTQDNLPVYFIS